MPQRVHRLVLPIALALAGVACATLGKRGEVQPEVVSAREYLHGYWNQPAQSDAQFRGRVLVVVGLVAERRVDPGTGVALDLQTDERGYFVRCLMSSGSAAASSELQRGQLVAVRGSGQGLWHDMPELGGCEISWMGDRPGSRRADPEGAAVLTARSAKLCAAKDRQRALAELHLDPDIPQVKKEREDASGREARYRALLKTSGAAPLPCDHPLVQTVLHCASQGLFAELGAASIVEGRRIFVSPKPAGDEREAGSECSSSQVVDAVERMRSDE